jgi:hypothetical protein
MAFENPPDADTANLPDSMDVPVLAIRNTVIFPVLAFPINVGPMTIEIFPYKVHFRTLKTHILLDKPMADDFETARDQLYQALLNCRVFCSNVRWGDADTFQFTAEADGRLVTCGDSLESHEGVMLKVELPRRATIKLIRDGREVIKTDSKRLEFGVSAPGLYRVEAWSGKRGWIFSNHIRIGVDRTAPKGADER